MKKILIIFIVLLIGFNTNAQTIGVRIYGAQFDLPLAYDKAEKVGFTLGYSLLMPINKINTKLNYSSVININEFPEDHLTTYKNQVLHVDNIQFGIIYNVLAVSMETGCAKLVDVIDCYDKFHILGANGKYQLLTNPHYELAVGINVKVTIPKTFLYLEYGYNTAAGHFGGIGINLLGIF